MDEDDKENEQINSDEEVEENEVQFADWVCTDESEYLQFSNFPEKMGLFLHKYLIISWWSVGGDVQESFREILSSR